MIKLPNPNKILIGLVKYWRGLEALLNRTPKKTIANYMIFSIVYNTVGYLSPTEYGGIIEKFVTVSLCSTIIVHYICTLLILQRL